jgi:hypothetical protein
MNREDLEKDILSEDE